MSTPDNWRKSSYSGPGDGNSCVEVANDLTQVAIRDSKTPTRATLNFPTGVFATFVGSLKTRAHPTAIGSSRVRD
ncbi:DUF397 domain-containing protein [Streptomyces sp. NPDC005402]|uniref:DUF397 domain-containing protein n=1 Tax=Streptomyces sp. NPDC005402 TaxID=3155338 RepID=UPI0033AC7B6C